jgi:hypothetical protein
MAWRATENLRFYLQEAALPALTVGPLRASDPQKGLKAHQSPFASRLERPIVLGSVRRFKAAWFDRQIKICASPQSISLQLR